MRCSESLLSLPRIGKAGASPDERGTQGNNGARCIVVIWQYNNEKASFSLKKPLFIFLGQRHWSGVLGSVSRVAPFAQAKERMRIKLREFASHRLEIK